MRAQAPSRTASARIVVAVVGTYQIGKSSLINCLLPSTGRKAKVGNGWKSETMQADEYVLPDDIVLVDTPGVDDNAGRDACTMDAIKRAHCVLFVCENSTAPGELYSNWAGQLKRGNKPCLFVCNCREGNAGRRQRWNPQSEWNADFCRKSVSEAFIAKNGFDMFMTVGGRQVLPVNACWALYGKGELDDEEKNDDVETVLRREGVDGSQLREAAWARSNVPLLCEFIRNVRLEILSHSLTDRNRIVAGMADRFREELAMRLSGRKAR